MTRAAFLQPIDLKFVISTRIEIPFLADGERMHDEAALLESVKRLTQQSILDAVQRVQEQLDLEFRK